MGCVRKSLATGHNSANCNRSRPFNARNHDPLARHRNFEHRVAPPPPLECCPPKAERSPPFLAARDPRNDSVFVVTRDVSATLFFNAKFSRRTLSTFGDLLPRRNGGRCRGTLWVAPHSRVTAELYRREPLAAGRCQLTAFRHNVADLCQPRPSAWGTVARTNM